MSRFVYWFAVLGFAWVILPTVRADDIYLKETATFDENKFKMWLQEESATPPTQTQLAEAGKGARTVVYRITEHANHVKPGEMARAVSKCDYLMKEIVYSPETKNALLQQAFAGQMLEALTAVLKPKEQHAITRVNAARVLARLAELSGSEETADLAVKIIDNPDQVDGARYWAFRTLKNLFSRATKPVSAARREKAVELLVQFIERPNKVGKDTPIEELDGIRMVRREAIRALGAVRDPGVANKKGAEAAWTLVRILRRDKDVTPEPRLDEQVEAAVGLSNLRPDPKGDYRPAFAIYHVGQFVREFFIRWTRERVAKREPWKIHAARMEEALQGLAAAVPDETIKKVVPAAVVLVQGVQKGKESPTAAGLEKLLGELTPPPSVYKSNPKAIVNPRED
ncbi:MAG: hypothetical protein HYS12_07025 [Planctomycetes bacterium]|nr:hypothetical protein [Planctomycetota bacterium]